MAQNTPYPHNGASNPGRARKVITRSGAIVRGKFPSKKNQRMIHHEGLMELEACYLFEMSPFIAAYREQPIKIRYADGDRLRRYTPDFELTLKTGKTALIEVKHSAILARTEVRHKYHQIAVHMRRTSQTYCILTDKDIRLEPRLSSFRYAYVQLAERRPTQARLDSLVSSLSSLEGRSIMDANLLLAPYGLSAFDLLASGHLVCDLTQPLGASTKTLISRENNHDWVRISEELSF